MQETHSLTGCTAIKLSNLKRRTVETACTHDFFLLLLRDQYECFEIFFWHGGEDC